MNNVKNIINETGISKVKIAKYLGVSRQMLYNYLDLEDIDDLPKDKQNRLFLLFGISDKSQLLGLNVNETYIAALEAKISEEMLETAEKDIFYDIKGLNKKEQELLSDIFHNLKDMLVSDKKDEQSFATLKYLNYYLQAMKQIPELQYILAYMAKNNIYVNPLEFVYDEDKQYTFEGILYSAMTLYSNGRALPNKVVDSHQKWELEIEKKKEEKLGRTQELQLLKIQALKELGYTEVNTTNSREVFEKIAEIMSRNA